MRAKIWWTGVALLSIAGGLGIWMEVQDRQGENKDAALMQQVISEISEIHPPPGSLQIYRETTANRDCNRARATVVYSVDLGSKEICQSLYSSLEEKWQKQPCVERKGAFANLPPYSYQRLEASADYDESYFLHDAYGAEAHAQFWPINIYIENDVIKLARKLGKSYFYVHVEFRGSYDQSKYPCHDGNYECYCTSSTSFQSTAGEVRRLLQ